MLISFLSNLCPRKQMKRGIFLFCIQEFVINGKLTKFAWKTEFCVIFIFLFSSYVLFIKCFNSQLYSATRLTIATEQSFLQSVRQLGYVHLIDSHASLQSSHSCKLNTAAWVVDLMYLHVIVKCEILLSGRSKACCTVK